MSLATYGLGILPRVRAWDVDTRLLALLTAFALARGVLYAIVPPPFEGPDESGHYQYITSLFQSGGARAEGAQASQPPLYYWLMLPPFALVADRSPLVGLLVVRLVSMLMAVAVVPLSYLAARVLWPRERGVHAATAAVVALVPAYGWVGASVNNDNLANLASAGIIYLLVLGLSSGFSPGRSLGLLGLAGIGVATKAITWPVVAVGMVILVGSWAYRGFARKPAVTAVGSLGLILAAVTALVGPLDGLVLAKLGEMTTPLRDGVAPSGGHLMSVDSFARFLTHLDRSPFVHQFETFWGTFHNDSVYLPTGLYGVLWVAAGVALVGLLVQLVGSLRVRVDGTRRVAVRRSFALQAVVLVVLIGVQWLMPFLRLYRESLLGPLGVSILRDFPLMQGRFVFPVMIPIAFFFALGWASIVPRQWAKHATMALVMLLLVTDWIALAVAVGGYYSWQR